MSTRHSFGQNRRLDARRRNARPVLDSMLGVMAKSATRSDVEDKPIPPGAKLQWSDEENKMVWK